MPAPESCTLCALISFQEWGIPAASKDLSVWEEELLLSAYVLGVILAWRVSFSALPQSSIKSMVASPSVLVSSHCSGLAPCLRNQFLWLYTKGRWDSEQASRSDSVPPTCSESGYFAEPTCVGLHSFWVACSRLPSWINSSKPLEHCAW